MKMQDLLESADSPIVVKAKKWVEENDMKWAKVTNAAFDVEAKEEGFKFKIVLESLKRRINVADFRAKAEVAMDLVQEIDAKKDFAKVVGYGVYFGKE